MQQTTYLEEARKRNPPQTLETLLISKGLADPITDKEMEAIKAMQKYKLRERIPQHLLPLLDTYHEVTQQIPTGQTFSDWIETAEGWYTEDILPEHIRAAWNYSLSEKGFNVGRPGALTVTARSMKSKAGAQTAVAINYAAIEATRQAANEKWSGNFVPRPAHIKKPIFKKGMEPK